MWQHGHYMTITACQILLGKSNLLAKNTLPIATQPQKQGRSRIRSGVMLMVAYRRLPNELIDR
jgi:hypothetical protein